VTQPAPRCTPLGALSWLAKLNLACLAAAVAAYCVFAWPGWRDDENLGHGVFLPVLALVLLLESRRDPNPAFAGPGRASAAAFSALLLGSLLAAAAAVVYASELGWTFALAGFMLSASLTLLLGAAWAAFADDRVRFLPLNWAAAVAVGLWILSSSPPPGTYARLALSLQGLVTRAVVFILGSAGIAAYRDGNVIELARASVGVSEACSGVRSLISCLAAGLFLSAVLLRRPAHRALVVAVSPLLGLAMNLVRSLILTLLVNAGVQIEGRWHDLTGASIIVVTTILVASFAVWLRRRETPEAAPSPASPPPPRRFSGPQAALAVFLLAAGALGTNLSGRVVSPHAAGAPAPELESLLPGPPPGWSAVTTPDLDQYSGVLKTRALAERVYAKGGGPDAPRVSLYLAYWRPGQAPVSLVDAHSPDACWPGTGWEPDPARNDRMGLRVKYRTLAPAECRFFTHGPARTRVWFWHLYGGKPLAYVDPYSAVRLLGLAWRYGFTSGREQLFVRVSSNRPWSEIASGPVLEPFFRNLEPLGL
jgi:exosortase